MYYAYQTKCGNPNIWGKIFPFLQGSGVGCTDYIYGKTPIHQQALPATNPENKSAICAKSCDLFDVFCKSGKLQAGCGGGCGPIPIDCTFVFIGGGLVLMLVLILALKRR